MNTIKTVCCFCKKSLIRKIAPSIKTKTHFCDNKCKGEYQRTFKPVTKEWLYEHYVVKHLDTTQIAHIVNRNPKSVWNWLKDFNIQTRSRGGFTSPNCFMKGQVNLMQGKKHSAKTKKLLSVIAKQRPNMNLGNYMRGRIGINHHGWKGGLTPERQAFYSSMEWIESVKKVWKRDNAICQKCGAKHNSKLRGTFHIHHIVSFMVREKRADVNNLILLCDKCHRWVHGKKNKNKELIGD